MDANLEWATKEWLEGECQGFEDRRIHYLVLERKSVYFQLGFRRGKDAIEACIDSESEFRASGGYER
jgi:hypothetical protein